MNTSNADSSSLLDPSHSVSSSPGLPLSIYDNANVGDVLRGIPSIEGRTLCRDFAAYLDHWALHHHKNNQISLNSSVNTSSTSTSLFGAYDFHFLFKSFAGPNHISLPEKESLELHALWVVFFRLMRRQPNVERLFKYPTMESFQAAYGHKFQDVDETELHKLYSIANWMAILFTMVESRGNKGLAMNVIPKLVEGFQVKYTTGGGQSIPTSHRVVIYEREGKVKPVQRPKRQRSEENLLSSSASSAFHLHNNNNNYASSQEGLLREEGRGEGGAKGLSTVPSSPSLQKNTAVLLIDEGYAEADKNLRIFQVELHLIYITPTSYSVFCIILSFQAVEKYKSISEASIVMGAHIHHAEPSLSTGST